MKLYLKCLIPAESGPIRCSSFIFYVFSFENEVSMLDDLIVVSFLCRKTFVWSISCSVLWRLWFVCIIVLLKLVAIWMSLVNKFLRYLCSTQYWSNANDAASLLDLLWNLSFVKKQELRFRVCILWMLGMLGLPSLAWHAWMITGNYDRCSLSFCP